LPNYIAEKRLKFKVLTQREAELSAELLKKETYSDEIDRLRDELKEIDTQLGVGAV
jgi:cell shape-determining protein MreC